jgi:sulfate permease, SulP family
MQDAKAWGTRLGADLTPGLTTAAVVVPKALAYATIAQLPVEAGLFAAMVPMAVYAVLGSSRLLSVSTTTPIAILCATAIGEALRMTPDLAPLTAAATLSVLVGLMLIAARLLRLGFVANFISEPVLTGFKAGVGFVIVIDQLPKLFGIHFDKGGFFENVVSILRHLSEISWPTLPWPWGPSPSSTSPSTSCPNPLPRCWRWRRASSPPPSWGWRRWG